MRLLLLVPIPERELQHAHAGELEAVAQGRDLFGRGDSCPPPEGGRRHANPDGSLQRGFVDAPHHGVLAGLHRECVFEVQRVDKLEWRRVGIVQYALQIIRRRRPSLHRPPGLLIALLSPFPCAPSPSARGPPWRGMKEHDVYLRLGIIYTRAKRWSDTNKLWPKRNSYRPKPKTKPTSISSVAISISARRC